MTDMMRRSRLLLIVLCALCSFGVYAKGHKGALSADGPYILYTDSGVRVIQVDSRGRISDKVLPEVPSSFTVTDHRGKVSFEVSLRPTVRQAWRDTRQPERLFVMSDPHGKLDCVISLLSANGVIDKDLKWSFGQDQLVVIGDIFDRGDDVVQIYWLFYKLQQEAEDAGGRVTMLLGNHEPMEFSGDMRYATPKYEKLAKKLGIEYRDLFGPSSELGRWIASWNTIGIIGRDLFVHAGLGGDFYRWNIPAATVNRRMSDVIFMRNKERKAVSDTLGFLYGSYGPIWYRGLVVDKEKYRPVQADTLDMILDRFGVEHMIVGHTIFEDVTTFHDGRLVDVNVDNRVNMEKQLGRALLVEGDRYIVVGDKGRIRDLALRSKGLFRRLNDQAAQEYLKPVRPASEGRNPCWNAFAKKFMYAPAFDFAPVAGASAYRFTVKEKLRGGKWSFESSDPAADLSPVWNDIRPGHVVLEVEALDAGGNVLGKAYEREFVRDYPYSGPYKAPVRDYREAAIKGALYVHLMPEIQNWIGSDIPDMAYPHNTYPCKIIGATIRNECFIARELPARRENALEVARSAAAFLVRMSHPEGHPLAFFPPTYYLDLEASKRDWNKGKTMTLEAASAGHAFLDLYDLTGEKEWLDRAVGIARTYVRLQREDGSLPIKIDFETAEPVNDVSAMLHPLLRYFQRLRGYGIEEFIPAQQKAEKWMDEVAVETFDMTGQFEDVNVKGLQPYQNLTNCTAAPYASYLLDKKDITDKNLSDAKDLIRLSEDQFVHWAYPDLTEDGFPKKNAPCVHEQYHYEMPVDNSACNVANAWLDYYELTGDLLSLAKAKAMADQMTIQQNANNGQLPTTWEWRDSKRDRNRTFWVNCSFSSVNLLMRMASLEEDLKKLEDK